MGFAAILCHNQYFRQLEDGTIEYISDPDDDSGLVVKRMDGQELAVRIDDSDFVIQGGLVL